MSIKERMQTVQTLVRHPSTGNLFSSELLWNDATFALSSGNNSKDFRRVTSAEAMAIAAIAGWDCVPTTPGESSEPFKGNTSY